MRVFKGLSLLAAGAVLAGTALTAGSALADPVGSNGKPVVPKYYDIVAVGADTDDTLFDQLAYDYDTSHKTHNATHPYIYSWDATPPNNPLNLTSTITPKQGCDVVNRPDGSGAGLTTWEADFGDKTGPKGNKHPCIDFVRSAQYRSSSDHLGSGKGGDLYVRLAEDAETYAVNKGGNAPTNLTTADLKAIYSCTATTWGQVGVTGAAASQPIVALLPPTTAGVTKFWLTALGLSATPAACLNEDASVTVQQNEGIEPVFYTTVNGKKVPNPNVIVPVSIGKYIAQKYHSAALGKLPSKTENKFGRNEVGNLVLGAINGKAATVGTGVNTKIDTKLDEGSLGDFLRPIYDVVLYATTSKNGDHIPNYLEPFLASATAKVKGWFCANSEAKQAIENYGFLTTPACGLGS